ncbi:hypothetical protein KO504_04145 [Winogradskyella psychrotolerans]|uniref:hypothetical protein n=1 Tax=Winogradskyella psychrotolerans TaxID=1344585 RepID=UPI001C07C5A4|nr:hypothetical protein [Winogradskyella psychrotolerans]MBU2920521.1 hypothetical protein [Winogradskyella psychrotolerans]
MTENNRKTLELVKGNLSLILLVPTILGGFWQLFELQKISTSFIRFFSISQVIADGLLILFVLSIIYLSFKFGVYLSANIEKEPRILYKIRLFLLPVILSLPIILFIIRFNKNKEINVFLLDSALFSATLLIGILVEIIGKKRINKIFLNEWFRELIFPIIIAISLIGSIYFISFVFKIFHKSFLLPENLKNVENIECLVKRKIQTFQILYLNDKYIFLELVSENEKKRIEIIEFKELFKKNNCR